MNTSKSIHSALISVYHKDGLGAIVQKLSALGVTIYSTGGTYDFIQSKGIAAIKVEDLTSYPSIFGGRVKTLHPKIFGGILYRRGNEQDQNQADEYRIPPIDLVIVDLYPFEESVAAHADEVEIVEKIDIGGVSLIRAAAKNFEDVVVVASRNQYAEFLKLLDEKDGSSELSDRLSFATQAFLVSSHYDTAIFNYFNQKAGINAFSQNLNQNVELRYGENPHQQGVFYGDLSKVYDQLHGKAISYNNLVDLDAALALISEFSGPAFVIIKHTNACGVAVRRTLKEAWADALAGDPVSAYGGVVAANRIIDFETATEVSKLFFEIIIAPGYEKNALEILKTKKNRIILQIKPFDFQAKQFKSILNGVIEQLRDTKTETVDDLQAVTAVKTDQQMVADLLFANIIVKHLKSNAIVLARNGQLLGAGCGMTSRVDALRHAIAKAAEFGLDLNGAVMASDAFFPFADSVGLAHEAGIKAVVQPGGSVRDEDSINYCNLNGMAMFFTSIRHFKH